MSRDSQPGALYKLGLYRLIVLMCH